MHLCSCDFDKPDCRQASFYFCIFTHVLFRQKQNYNNKGKPQGSNPLFIILV